VVRVREETIEGLEACETSHVDDGERVTARYDRTCGVEVVLFSSDAAADALHDCDQMPQFIRRTVQVELCNPFGDQRCLVLL